MHFNHCLPKQFMFMHIDYLNPGGGHLVPWWYLSLLAGSFGCHTQVNVCVIMELSTGCMLIHNIEFFITKNGQQDVN